MSDHKRINYEYERIDPIRSSAEMKRQLWNLSADERRGVILLALRKSRYQWTWSYFAKFFNVPY